MIILIMVNNKNWMEVGKSGLRRFTYEKDRTEVGRKIWVSKWVE